MSDTIRHLQLPLSEDETRDLALGSLVTVSGLVFTGRSRFHIRAIERGIVPPIDFRAVNCFFHVGPVVRREDAEWKTVSIEPTSSIRLPGRSIDRHGEPVEVVTHGRHDPCVGIRATPIAEAMVAIVLLDHLLRHRGQNADVSSGTPVVPGSAG